MKVLLLMFLLCAPAFAMDHATILAKYEAVKEAKRIYIREGLRKPPHPESYMDELWLNYEVARVAWMNAQFPYIQTGIRKRRPGTAQR